MKTGRMAATKAVVLLLACFLGCSKSGGASGGNQLELGVCDDKCIRSCESDSECNIGQGELCCDYGNDGKACADAKDCPRQCMTDSKCDTASGEACVRESLHSPLLSCDKPSNGLRLCQSDANCMGAGEVCCPNYKEPICLPADKCPKACANSAACNTTLGEVCCTTLASVDVTLVAGGLCVVPSVVGCPTACAKSSDCKTSAGELCCNGLCSTSCQQPCKVSADCGGQVCCKAKAMNSPFVQKYKKPGYTVVAPPPTGTGGTGGTGGAGGGTGGTAGTTGAGGQGGDTGTGLAIVPNNGYVSSATNGVGVQGYFYTYSDGFASILPASFSAAGTQICASGTTAAVVGMNYATYYGAGIGLNLNQAAGSNMPPMVYDFAGHQVSGFTFTISGTAIPSGLVVGLRVQGSTTSYCQKVPVAGTYKVTGTSVHADCTAAVPGGPLAATAIDAISWLVTGQAAAVPFNFCITNLAAISP